MSQWILLVNWLLAIKLFNKALFTLVQIDQSKEDWCSVNAFVLFSSIAIDILVLSVNANGSN